MLEKVIWGREYGVTKMFEICWEMYISGFAFVLRIIAILGVLLELFLHKTDENKKGLKRTLFRVLLSSAIYIVYFSSAVSFPIYYFLLVAYISIITGLSILWTLFLLICFLLKECFLQLKDVANKGRKRE